MNRLRKCLLVGHCGADAFALESLVSRACPDLPVAHVSDQETVEREAGADALLLVNRVLDGVFAEADGTALIRHLGMQAAEAGAAPATMMLISNFDTAQRAAREAGAIVGFGKQSLYADATSTYLRQVVEAGGGG